MRVESRILFFRRGRFEASGRCACSVVCANGRGKKKKFLRLRVRGAVYPDLWSRGSVTDEISMPMEPANFSYRSRTPVPPVTYFSLRANERASSIVFTPRRNEHGGPTLFGNTRVPPSTQVHALRFIPPCVPNFSSGFVQRPVSNGNADN